MLSGAKVLAVIPARGGSKGVPRKNIKPLAGRPLIAWTIAAAKASRHIDDVVVTTDDREIARAARRWGAEAPFLRPRRLATDTAKSIDAIIHAVRWLEDRGRRYGTVVILQPTSPLRTARDIDDQLAAFAAKRALMTVSVCPAEHPPYWCGTLPADGCLRGFLRARAGNKNRQELPVFYRLNGAIEVSTTAHLLRRKNAFGARTFAHVMPAQRSVDIDGELDFVLAEALLRRAGRSRG